MSVLRLQSLVAFSTSSNITWEYLNVSIWSAVELTVAVICACMPHMRLVLVSIFPVLLDTTRRSSSYIRNNNNNDNNDNGQTGRSGGWSRNREPSFSRPHYNPDHGHSANVTTSEGSIPLKKGSVGHSTRESDEDLKDGDGITYQMTYAVQHSDNDDIGLMTMDRMDSQDRSRWP